MKSYSEMEVFALREVRLLQRATALVAAVTENDVHGALIRCHELTRAVQAVLQPQCDQRLDVHDGKYASVEHSWIHVDRGDEGGCILDVYCVARLPQVQLVGADWMAGHSVLYRPWLAQRQDIRDDIVDRLMQRMSRVP